MCPLLLFFRIKSRKYQTVIFHEYSKPINYSVMLDCSSLTIHLLIIFWLTRFIFWSQTCQEQIENVHPTIQNPKIPSLQWLWTFKNFSAELFRSPFPLFSIFQNNLFMRKQPFPERAVSSFALKGILIHLLTGLHKKWIKPCWTL